MKARLFTAVVMATMALSAVATRTAHADLQLVGQYSDITSQSGTDGYYGNDGCGSSSSVGSYGYYMYSSGHIGVATNFVYTSSNGAADEGNYSFDLTASIYGSVSAHGYYFFDDGASGSSGSGVDGSMGILISDSCQAAASSSTGPGNANYGPKSASQSQSVTVTDPGGLTITAYSYADSTASSIPRAGATAISSANVSINNLQKTP